MERLKQRLEVTKKALDAFKEVLGMRNRFVYQLQLSI